MELFGQRFAITDTLGKLANMAADCGELDRVAEGHLKSFTSGDRMYFDRKGLPGLSATPTARMMLATNNRPRFSDRSSGLWRRMLLVPFRIEVSAKVRIMGMDKPEWWLKSGELPGIFNWAIAGLYRLRQQGRFTEPALCRQHLEDYRTEVNPARAFLGEACEKNSLGEVSTSDLYAAYKKWCSENGYRPLGERQFGKEVFRRFPGVQKKKLRDGDERTRIYSGILLCEEKFI